MTRTRNGKVGNRELALDAGLLLLKGTPGQAFNDSAAVSEFLLYFVDLLAGLSSTDISILRAVAECGSFKAAARKLAPGRPSYRAYIQRRFKAFRKVSTEIEFKVGLQALTSASPQSFARDPLAPLEP